MKQMMKLIMKLLRSKLTRLHHYHKAQMAYENKILHLHFWVINWKSERFPLHLQVIPLELNLYIPFTPRFPENCLNRLTLSIDVERPILICLSSLIRLQGNNRVI